MISEEEIAKLQRILDHRYEGHPTMIGGIQIQDLVSTIQELKLKRYKESAIKVEGILRGGEAKLQAENEKLKELIGLLIPTQEPSTIDYEWARKEIEALNVD